MNQSLKELQYLGLSYILFNNRSMADARWFLSKLCIKLPEWRWARWMITW